LQTLWVCALALQELAGPAAETAETATDVISLVTRTGLFEQLVLALLVLFSVLSWGIVAYKTLAFRKAEAQTRQFLDVFRRSSKFSEVQAVCRSLGDSPLVGLFQAGYGELNTQLRGATGDKPAAGGARPTLKSLEAVDRALLRASGSELAKLIGIEMTEAHWQAIHFLREDYAAMGETPTLRRVSPQTGIGVKELFTLFPGKPAKKMAYVAGLPKPKGCV